MSDPEERGPAFDARKLIELVRRGDRVAIEQAYAMTFCTEMGRIVLAHHLSECGVGQEQGRGASTEDRHYAAGQHDAALRLAAAAGFGSAAMAVAVLSDELTQEENHARPETYPEPPGFLAGPDDEF